MRDEDIVNLVKTCWSDLKEACIILENDPFLVHERTSIDETALMLLLRWYSPEHDSIERHLDAIKLLLYFGADINASSCCGSNPLHNAIASEQIDIVKYLISKDANINHEFGFYGQTSLHLAVLCKNVEMTEYLLENGADINATDDLGETPLHKTVAEDSQIEFTKLLVQHGADVNAFSGFETTPLDEAYRDGSVLNIKYLIDAGASINRITWDKIPNEIFKEEAYTELLKPLLERDASKLDNKSEEPIKNPHAGS